MLMQIRDTIASFLGWARNLFHPSADGRHAYAFCRIDDCQECQQECLDRQTW